MSVVISREEVAHLARLSRLAVTDAELDRFAGQLDVILQAVARVGEVAAADIPPTSHSVPLTNVLREDIVVPGLARDEALAGAPDAVEGPDATEGADPAEDAGAPDGDGAAAGRRRYFRVPRILDEEA